jgi:hypothetical protein
MCKVLESYRDDRHNRLEPEHHGAVMNKELTILTKEGKDLLIHTHM